jgi:hypothetical protein
MSEWIFRAPWTAADLNSQGMTHSALIQAPGPGLTLLLVSSDPNGVDYVIVPANQPKDTQ